MRFRFAILASVALQACGSVSEPAQDATITGPIVARDASISIGGPPTIHVKKASDQCGIIFLVRPTTTILRKSDGKISPASQNALVTGAQVSVWTDVVLESCPAQADAHVIEILD